MKVRKEDSNNDIIFGFNNNNYTQDTSEAVAICIKNRLKMILGSWFLDIRKGLDYDTILGMQYNKNYDSIIQREILNTQGVLNIKDYNSSIDIDKRILKVNCSVNTIYGEFLWQMDI